MYIQPGVVVICSTDSQHHTASFFRVNELFKRMLKRWGGICLLCWAVVRSSTNQSYGKWGGEGEGLRGCDLSSSLKTVCRVQLYQIVSLNTRPQLPAKGVLRDGLLHCLLPQLCKLKGHDVRPDCMTPWQDGWHWKWLRYCTPASCQDQCWSAAS